MLHDQMLIITSAMYGAIGALVINEVAGYIRHHVSRRNDRRKLADLCVKHLRLIRDGIPNIERDEIAEEYHFSETNYAELSVGHFLHDLITSNIALFDIAKLGYTIKFFHGYKVQMSNIRKRLDLHAVELRQTEISNTSRPPAHPTATLTRETFEGLLKDLELTIQELRGLAH